MLKINVDVDNKCEKFEQMKSLAEKLQDVGPKFEKPDRVNHTAWARRLREIGIRVPYDTGEFFFYPIGTGMCDVLVGNLLHCNCKFSFPNGPRSVTFSYEFEVMCNDL